MAEWLVISLPDPIGPDDIEAEGPEEESLSYREAYAEGYNSALADVKHKLTGGRS